MLALIALVLVVAALGAALFFAVKALLERVRRNQAPFFDQFDDEFATLQRLKQSNQRMQDLLKEAFAFSRLAGLVLPDLAASRPDAYRVASLDASADAWKAMTWRDLATCLVLAPVIRDMHDDDPLPRKCLTADGQLVHSDTGKPAKASSIGGTRQVGGGFSMRVSSKVAVPRCDQLPPTPSAVFRSAVQPAAAKLAAHYDQSTPEFAHVSAALAAVLAVAASGLQDAAQRTERDAAATSDAQRVVDALRSLPPDQAASTDRYARVTYALVAEGNAAYAAADIYAKTAESLKFFGMIGNAASVAEKAAATSGEIAVSGSAALAAALRNSKLVTSIESSLSVLQNPALGKTLAAAGVVFFAAMTIQSIAQGRPGDVLLNGIQLAGASTAAATALGAEAVGLATANALFGPAAAAAGVLQAGGALADYFAKYCPCSFPKRETHAGIPVCYKENGHSHPVTAKKPHCQWKDYACQHGFVATCTDLPNVRVLETYRVWSQDNGTRLGDWVVPK